MCVPGAVIRELRAEQSVFMPFSPPVPQAASRKSRQWGVREQETSCGRTLLHFSEEVELDSFPSQLGGAAE